MADNQGVQFTGDSAVRISAVVQSVERVTQQTSSRTKKTYPPGLETVLLKVTTARTGGGIYNGATVTPKASLQFDPDTSYAVDDLFDTMDDDNLYVISRAELGSERHEIPEGTLVFGRYAPFASTDRRVVFIEGSILNLRYNTTSHYAQVAYGQAVSDSDWSNKIQFTVCP